MGEKTRPRLAARPDHDVRTERTDQPDIGCLEQIRRDNKLARPARFNHFFNPFSAGNGGVADTGRDFALYPPCFGFLPRVVDPVVIGRIFQRASNIHTNSGLAPALDRVVRARAFAFGMWSLIASGTAPAGRTIPARTYGIMLRCGRRTRLV